MEMSFGGEDTNDDIHCVSWENARVWLRKLSRGIMKPF
jgi:hypothetical protein